MIFFLGMPNLVCHERLRSITSGHANDSWFIHFSSGCAIIVKIPNMLIILQTGADFKGSAHMSLRKEHQVMSNKKYLPHYDHETELWKVDFPDRDTEEGDL